MAAAEQTTAATKILKNIINQVRRREGRGRSGGGDEGENIFIVDCWSTAANVLK